MIVEHLDYFITNFYRIFKLTTSKKVFVFKPITINNQLELMLSISRCEKISLATKIALRTLGNPT